MRSPVLTLCSAAETTFAVVTHIPVAFRKAHSWPSGSHEWGREGPARSPILILAGSLTLWEAVLPLRVGLSSVTVPCKERRRGGRTGERRRLKPNCVLSNPSAEDSPPSPSRPADKCRSRPPVCQGCLNWYQDVPGLHRPCHCLPPCLLPPAAVLASLWLPTSIPGRGSSAHSPRRRWRPAGTTPPRALTGELPLPREGNSICPAQEDVGGGTQRRADRHGVHVHVNNLDMLKGRGYYPCGKVLLTLTQESRATAR